MLPVTVVAQRRCAPPVGPKCMACMFLGVLGDMRGCGTQGVRTRQHFSQLSAFSSSSSSVAVLMGTHLVFVGVTGQAPGSSTAGRTASNDAHPSLGAALTDGACTLRSPRWPASSNCARGAQHVCRGRSVGVHSVRKEVGRVGLWAQFS